MDLSTTIFVLLSVTETDIQLDTLFSSDTFSFEVLKEKLSFQLTHHRQLGNKFSLETIKPVQPNLKIHIPLRLKVLRLIHKELQAR